jgi:hypothetical protein
MVPLDAGPDVQSELRFVANEESATLLPELASCIRHCLLAGAAAEASDKVCNVDDMIRPIDS